MKNLLVLLFTMVSFGIMGQRSPILIKAYLNGEFEGDNLTRNTTRVENASFGRVTFGIQKKFRNGLYSELELSDLLLRRENRFDALSREKSSVRTLHLGFRYELGVTLKKTARYNWQLGLAVNPGFRRIRDEVSNGFELTTREFLFTTSIIPRFNYQISDTFLIDFNGIIDFFSLMHMQLEQADFEQSDRGENYWFPASIGFRVGLVYKLGKS